MTGYVTPTTWEQCARHVEAGGIVEIEDAPGVWINDRAAATYRGRCGTPDDGWAPRRLVPIESAAPANGVPAVPTGAERYLAERLADPEYRAAYEPPAPVTGDDLRERIVKVIDDWHNTVEMWTELDDLADAVLAVLPPQPTPSPVPPWVVPPCICKSYNLDGQAEGRKEVVLDRPDWMPDGERVNGVPVDECIARVVRFLWDNDVRTWGSCCGHNGRYGPPSLLLDRREDIAWVRALIADVDPRIWHLDWVRTPPPVPPWPGAVLSGLTDEDGVPTWLAQAGQVRGEQVRRRSDFVWVNNDQMVAHLDTVWVEVRDPRAVPEPETERVQLGVAVVGGLLAICREGGTLDLGRGDVRIHTENGALVASTSESMFTVEIDPDGTVEVLKDSDR